MAATGGGKIRSRRYHIASKPYAKSKQQQSGLISRVTDTVKSIVPSWLQKYFKNEDGPEGGGSEQGRDLNCQLSPPPPPQPPNGNEEGPPVDGRDSPEPSTSNTEPTTSRASLNFQEFVLSRPPLNRSHLHFTPLDASSPSLGNSNNLFSQPSTSTAPGPFTTGFSLVKEIKDNLSQHEDDNISTTSGFSSRASDKDVPTSKTASLPQLWSPEMDRGHTGPQPSQSSMKKPAFNLSVFGTSSNTSFNNTVLSSSQLGDSPFYPGKTTYGGAAAARSSRSRPGTPYQAPMRRQIKAKPAGAQPCGVTSATARRILQSLERMSSPLADARRIPSSVSSPLSTTIDSINLDVPHSQAKKKRMDTTLPPVQKLVVPSVASMSGNRSMSFRPTLTPGGLSRPVDKAPAETPTRQSPQLPEASPRPSQSTTGYSAPAYPLSSTPAANSVTVGGGKMKRERSSARVSSKRQEEDEVPELPDLPTISLPISSSALPNFTFTSPLPASTISNTPSVTVTPAKETDKVKETPTASSPPSVPFTFSSPIVKATPASTPSFSPSAGFTFSAPVAKGPSISNGKLAIPKVAAVKPAPSKSTEDSEGLFKPAKTLKQGSVLDLLKTPGFASPVQSGSCPDDAPQQTTASPSSSSTTTTTTSSLSSSTGFGDLFKSPPGWNCDVCLVQNKPSDTKCVCCTTPQPNSSSSSPPLDNKPSTSTSVGLESSSATSTTTTGFAAVFTKPAGTWDCDTCLVRNKSDAVKCVACETAKPGTGLKTSLTIPSAFSAIKAESTPAPPVSTGFVGFGDKFKKPEGAWECDTCMVENKAEATKCVACMNTKPGASAEASAGASTSVSSAPALGFGDVFKKPEGSWDCDVCLVQNKSADVECVACQTPKPGAKVEPKADGASSSSTFGSSTPTSGGFKFGSAESSSASASEGFKFGSSFGESSAPSTGFKFGVPLASSPPEPASQDGAASSGFKFGGSSGGFKFGTTASDNKKSDQPAAAAASGFKFGGSGGAMFGTGSSGTENKGGFSFGVTKPEDKPPTNPAPTSSISATPAPPEEKSDSTATPNNATSNANPAPEAAAATTTTKGSIFTRLGEPSTAAPAPQAGSIFGSLQTSKEPAAPTFTFGKPEEKKEVAPSPAPSSFVFGGANKDTNGAPVRAATEGFTFGKPSAPAEQAPPIFSFGKSADTTETTAAEPPKPAFTFGQSAADSSTSAPKPAFSFMVNNPSNSTTAVSSSSITSLFGAGPASTQAPAQAPPPAAASSTFMFSQPTTSSSDGPPAKAAFVFGQASESQPPAPSAPLNSKATPAPAQPFMFGASTTTAPPAAAAAPYFNFGTAAPTATSSSAPSAASSPFTFSSAPSGGFGANQTPSFGSSFGSPFTAPPTQTPPTFGANPNPTPVFGQPTNSTPAFGANANSSSGGGFQFGASGFGATNNTSGVFTFGAGAGAGAAASPAPPATPAVPPQTGAAGGGFNFAPLNFNMGSTKAFTASPAGQQAIAGRKFKMAVRRRK